MDIISLSALLLALPAAGPLSAQQQLAIPTGDRVSSISCSGETPITCPAVPAGEWQITLDSPAEGCELRLTKPDGTALEDVSTGIARGLVAPVRLYNFTLNSPTELVLTPTAPGDSPFFILLGRTAQSHGTTREQSGGGGGIAIRPNTSNSGTDGITTGVLLPVFGGIGCILLLAGGACMFLLRRGKRHESAAPRPAQETHPALTTDTETAPFLLLIDTPGAPKLRMGLHPKLLSAPILIGRKAPCAIIVADRAVSARHCSLRVENKHLVLQDENSTNGTKLNGQALTAGRSVHLRNEDCITIGDTTITIIRQH